MSRIARAEVFAHDEVTIIHVMNRVVRRCFLMGDDPVSGKNFDHRKDWIENELRRLSAQFGIDLLDFAILSNHVHLILRSRPDRVKDWDDAEVARHWWFLCPQRKQPDGSAAEPTQAEIDRIRNDPVKLTNIRQRLSDISWWMRLLCQKIAQMANAEDGEVGKFWQSRYRAVRLLDETAVLAASAYVALNPIRAGIAETLEASDYTSVQRRIEARMAADSPAQAAVATEAGAVEHPPGEPQPTPPAAEGDSAKSQAVVQPSEPDGFLAPVSLAERHNPVGSHPSRNGQRCSDKGYLAMTTDEYLALLDWTARQQSGDKRGRTPESLPPVLERLSLSPKAWCVLVSQFGRLFHVVAGRPTVIDETRSRVRQQRYRVKPAARELLATAA